MPRLTRRNFFAAPAAARLPPPPRRKTQARSDGLRQPAGDHLRRERISVPRPRVCRAENGADTLDAGLLVVTGPEDDPNDDSVGFGGLPNEEGVVELDSCCMHGPTRRAGSVGGVRNIKNVCKVAKAVMEHTGHVMLCGEGAERFAVAMGFPRENLLTEHSRKIWMLWRESHSNQDWWGPQIGAPNWVAPDAGPSTVTLHVTTERLLAMAGALDIPEEHRMDAVRKVLVPPTGTIHCSVRNAQGEVSGVTTTSGLAWKIPGRLGDSPIIGAGCYTDQDVGSAGATGSGEENIKVAGAHTIVENMRNGMSPQKPAWMRSSASRTTTTDDKERATLYRHDLLRAAERWRLRRSVTVER